MARSIKIVFDTCALIWWSLDPDKLSQQAKEACYQMEQKKEWFSSINNDLGNSYQDKKP